MEPIKAGDICVRQLNDTFGGREMVTVIKVHKGGNCIVRHIDSQSPNEECSINDLSLASPNPQAGPPAPSGEAKGATAEAFPVPSFNDEAESIRRAILANDAGISPQFILITGDEIRLIKAELSALRQSLATALEDRDKAIFLATDINDSQKNWIAKNAADSVLLGQLQSQLATAQKERDEANARWQSTAKLADSELATLKAERDELGKDASDKINCLVGYIQYLMKMHPLDDYAEIPAVCKDAEEYCATLKEQLAAKGEK